MTDRVYTVTPPQREAIRELAEAYAGWTIVRSINGAPRHWMETAKNRLLKAQDAFGIELVSREALLACLGHQEAA